MSHWLECFWMLGTDCSAAVSNMFTNAESWAPHTEAVATFPKSHIIECFFNVVAVSKHLGLAFQTRPLPAVGSGRKKRHLKLNLKMCFSWKPGCAAINQGRHFHAPHFSWFLSEFPPFLSHSTLAPELPTAALAADHSQQGTVGWPVPPSQLEQNLPPPPPKTLLVVLGWLSHRRIPQRIHLDSSTSALFHRPSQIIHCLHTQSWWPAVIS